MVASYPRYLAVWERPRTVTAVGAQRLLLDGRVKLEPTESMARVQHTLQHDLGISLMSDWVDKRDSLAILRISEEDISTVGPVVAEICRASRLVLYDIGAATLVVPGTTQSRQWPESPDALVAGLRASTGRFDQRVRVAELQSALAQDRLTSRGDHGDDSPNPNWSLIDIATIPFAVERLPLVAPDCVAYTVMQWEQPKKSSEKALPRLISDLAIGSPRRRYLALSALVGRGPSEAIDDAIRACAGNEPDRDLRVLCAVALAIRATGDRAVIETVAREALEAGRHQNQPEGQHAASVAVFAAAIDALWLRDSSSLATVREFIQELRGLSTQERCAAEIEMSFEKALRTAS